MRTGILGSVGALLVAAPLSLADPPAARPANPPASLSADLPADPLTLPGQLPPAPETPPAPAPAPTPTPTAQPTPPPAPLPAATNGCAPPAAANGCGQPPAKPAWHDYHCGPAEQVWLGGGYRAWWMKNGPNPVPLVTTGPPVGGVAGAPGGVVLFGGQDIDYGTFNGFDLHAGLWLDCRHTCGLELGGFYFGQQSAGGTFASDAAGSPALTRPVIDALTLNQVGFVVSAPGAVAGAVTVDTRSRFAGAEANIVKNLFHCQDYTVDSYFGFRYLDLEERLDIDQVSRPLGGGTLAFGGAPLPPGVGVAITDQFHTRNQFYGGQV
ncbi:MAG TPA: BBP7 family outer membrane beta-barrel protein, partial [Gemmataceae bacterium]